MVKRLVDPIKQRGHHVPQSGTFPPRSGQTKLDVLYSRRKGQRKKGTIYKCRQYNLSKCTVPCFELHHTKKDLESHLGISVFSILLLRFSCNIQSCLLHTPSCHFCMCCLFSTQLPSQLRQNSCTLVSIHIPWIQRGRGSFLSRSLEAVRR